MNKIVELIFGIAKPKIIFFSIFIGAISFLISQNIIVSFVILLIGASFYGFLDLWYVERKTILEQRCKIPYKVDIFTTFNASKDSIFFQPSKEFDYKGFKFKVPLIENHPPGFISYPLCPECDGFLIEAIQKYFPFRLSIVLKCNTCNITYKSKFSKAELINQVAEHFGHAVK